MEKVQFWLNDKDYKEAIEKLGSPKKLYGFAKDVFKNALKEVKEIKKEVWFECPRCHAEYHTVVKAMIEIATGRLIPVCDCGKSLVRRVKKVAD